MGRGREYNWRMARGWESKSVEAQQADASEKPDPGRVQLSPEQATLVRQIENLRLSRRQVVQRLEASSNPRHRQLLENTLSAIDERLRQLEQVTIGRP
jgi:hypothetical protein